MNNFFNSRLVLLPTNNELRLESLSEVSGKRLFVCDQYVSGAELWGLEHPWGWETTLDGRAIVNIDHHAPSRRFYRHVSTGNLAIDYVRQHGPTGDDDVVVITHTDCDSVISALVMLGELKPEDKFGQAVIAADHTGEPNRIADLLQGLDALKDFRESSLNLGNLLGDRELTPLAWQRLQLRLDERRLATEIVNSGAFSYIGNVAVAELPNGVKLAGEFLPSLLPDAWVIISAAPFDGGKIDTKVRLGNSAPAGTTLFDMGIRDFEPAFGGRWNAGSTKRSGGSTVSATTLAVRIAERLG